MNGKRPKNVRNYDVVRFIRVKNLMIVVTFKMHTSYKQLIKIFKFKGMK